jgi:hypothetical protein
LTAIDLDGQPEPGTIKVNDEIADWMLTTKAEAGHLGALQHGPKFPFSFCGGTA